MVTMATGGMPSSMATRKIVSAAMEDTPAASPSSPSMRLTVFVSPTIQKIVAGIARNSR